MKIFPKARHAGNDNHKSNYNIVLDMDGVVLDSESVKIAAFASLFTEYPDHLAAIDHYNRTHRGIPRAEKFAHVLTSILGQRAGEYELQQVGERYKSLLERNLPDVPLIRGIEQFLQLTRYTFFLNSSAPIAEIDYLMRVKALSGYFQTLYGYPHKKAEVLQHLKHQYQGQPLIFFGDAWADYQAAQVAGVRFIGVDTYQASTFASVEVPTIKDFGDLDQIIGLIENGD